MLFTGRITADAELSTAKGNRKVSNFTVALNQRTKNKEGDKKERTAFVECAYWSNTALNDYLRKGTVAEISGWVEAQYWTDREGQIHPRLACTVAHIQLFSGTHADHTTQSEAAEKAAPALPVWMSDPVAAVGYGEMEDDD